MGELRVGAIRKMSCEMALDESSSHQTVTSLGTMRQFLLKSWGLRQVDQGGGFSVAACKGTVEPKESQVSEASKVQGVFREQGYLHPFPSWTRGLVQAVNVQRAVVGGRDQVRRAKRKDEPWRSRAPAGPHGGWCWV